MTLPHEFSLRWDYYLRHITLAFDSLRSQETLVDVTLCCEGQKIRAHKVLLSAFSSYFRDIFKENPCQHPVIIFKNVKYDDLQAIIDFIYQGEVNVVQESLPSFLNTAELLSVQGLTDNMEYNSEPLTVCDTIEIPKITKTIPFTTPSTSSATAQIPTATIRTQCLSFIAPSSSTTTNQAPEYIEIERHPQPMAKKHKNVTHQQQQQQQQQDTNLAMDNLPSSDDMTYMQQEIKMEIPEYISMEATTSNSNSGHNIAVHNTSADVRIKTDEEDVLIQQKDNFTIIHDNDVQGAGGNCKKKRKVVPKSSKHEDGLQKTHAIKTVKMSRLCMQTSGNIKKGQEIPDGELKFHCSICGKGFKHPKSLLLHKNLHSGKTKCSVCYKAFSRIYDMKSHMTKIHKIIFKVQKKNKK